jgi:LPS sulfotransferase NodH
MLRRALLLYRIAAANFGTRWRPLLLLAALGLYRALAGVGMALDHVFFPAHRRVRIERPVFVIGNPRSGTTFLHRYLEAAGVGSGLRLWEMLVPSLTLRVIARPLVRWLERRRPLRVHLEAVHRTSLEELETDDVLLFLRFLDGLFYYVYVLAWDERAHEDYLDPAGRPAQLAARDLRWIAACYRRQLLAGGRPLGKFFSMPMRIPEVRRAFPDARFVYLVRDPAEALPSALSLATGVLREALPGWRPGEAQQRRYVQRITEASRALYAGFFRHRDEPGGPPADALVVRYDDLVSDFESVMRRILEFVGHPVDAALADDIRRTAQAQRDRVSEHRYSLEQFGLDRQSIEREFGFVYAAAGITPRRPPGAGPGTTPARSSSS